jgi:hypothetical protein
MRNKEWSGPGTEKTGDAPEAKKGDVWAAQRGLVIPDRQEKAAKRRALADETFNAIALLSAQSFLTTS